MADQEINLPKQCSRIGLSPAIAPKMAARSSEPIFECTEFRRERMTGAMAFTAVSGLPAKLPRA